MIVQPLVQRREGTLVHASARASSSPAGYPICRARASARRAAPTASAARSISRNTSQGSGILANPVIERIAHPTVDAAHDQPIAAPAPVRAAWRTMTRYRQHRRRHLPRARGLNPFPRLARYSHRAARLGSTVKVFAPQSARTPC
jgi:hypothetical protein